MINISDKKTIFFVQEIVKIVVGMIVALSWDTAINTLIDIIKDSFPIAGLLVSFFYAIVITVIAIILAVWFLRKIDNTDQGERKN